LVRVHDADEKYRTRPLARKKTESQRRVRGSISPFLASGGSQKPPKEIAAVWLNRRKSFAESTVNFSKHQDRERKREGFFFSDVK